MRTVNIVSLWDLGRRIHVIKPIKAFKADIIKDGSNCLLLFESGKIIATGFKTFTNVKIFIKSHYPGAKFIKIINITAVEFIREKINVKDLSYEPEIYPAHLWKRNKICIVYYASGKLIITGGKSQKELREAYREFKQSTSINREQHEH